MTITADHQPAPPTEAPTRRAALAGAALLSTGLATAGVLRPRPAAAANPEPPAPTPARRPVARDPSRRVPPMPVAGLLVADRAAHLVRRITYGATPGLVEQVRAMGEQAFLDAQLNPAAIDDSACEAAVSRRFPMLTMEPLAISQSGTGWEPMYQLVRATLLRNLASQRQLYEVMVEFWSNHFNITTPSENVTEYKGQDDRLVARANALGSFSDMLLASAASPAMLRFLDNASSRGTAPNENYGRELLELHTLGVNGGYTEVDVRQTTYALTGWTVDYATRAFAYRPSWHYTGPLKVLGWSHPNAAKDATGVEVGKSLLRYLARHRSTATRVATKLALRFVSDTPSAGLVKTLADTYLANDTQITPVLRVLFAHPEFWSSAGMKTRRPYEDALASLRVLGNTTADDSQVDAFAGWVYLTGNAGHAPLAWGPPNGYPDAALDWGGAGVTLANWNNHTAATDRWYVNKGMAAPTLQALYGGTKPATVGALVDLVCQTLLGQPVKPEHRAVLVTYLGKSWSDPADNPWQYGLSGLTKLILNSPYWSVR